MTNPLLIYYFLLFLSVDGSVKLTKYEASAAGIIQSFVERFPSNEYEKCVGQLWQKEKEYL